MDIETSDENLHELESISVPGSPNFTTQASNVKYLKDQIFVADLPIIDEVCIQNEKEPIAGNATDVLCTALPPCQNSFEIIQYTESFNQDDSSNIKTFIETDEKDFSDDDLIQLEIKKVTKKRVRKKPMRICDKIKLEPKFVCNICTTGFQRSNNYTYHMKKVHKITKDLTPHACPNCPRKYAYEYELKRHMKKYKPMKERLIFPCSICDRKFQTRVHLNRHIQHVHEDNRSFVCEECGQAVHTSTKLKEHMLVHTDHSPFKCMECGKSFKQKEGLKRHMATHGAKYVCGQCGKNLSTRFNLKKHLLVHDKIKQYKCDLCGSGFKLMTTLKVHLNTHTGHKIYECIFCDKIFAGSFSRLKHTRKMHPDELAEQEALSARNNVASALNLYDTLTRKAANKVASVRGNVFFNKTTSEGFTFEEFEMHRNAIDFPPNMSQEPVSRTLYNINSTVF
ncbi:zinc finger protein 92-like [Eurosta solidaginis]|uniref:zinc finger protein 92-like n=1 Tax=Eurosta solidaginis TaxID=178769 RepID=UPI0035316CB6